MQLLRFRAVTLTLRGIVLQIRCKCGVQFVNNLGLQIRSLRFLEGLTEETRHNDTFRLIYFFRLIKAPAGQICLYFTTVLHGVARPSWKVGSLIPLLLAVWKVTVSFLQGSQWRCVRDLIKMVMTPDEQVYSCRWRCPHGRRAVKCYESSITLEMYSVHSFTVCAAILLFVTAVNSSRMWPFPTYSVIFY